MRACGRPGAHATRARDHRTCADFKKGDERGNHVLNLTINELSMLTDVDYSSYKPGPNGWKDVFVRGFEVYLHGLNQFVSSSSMPSLSVSLEPLEGASQNQMYCNWTFANGQPTCTVAKKRFVNGESKLKMNHFGAFTYGYPDAENNCGNKVGALGPEPLCGRESTAHILTARDVPRAHTCAQKPAEVFGPDNSICDLPEAKELCGDSKAPTYCLSNAQMVQSTNYFFPVEGGTTWQSDSDSPLAMPSLYTTWQLTVNTNNDEDLERGFQALELTSCTADGPDDVPAARH